MADTTVDATVHSQLEMMPGPWGPYMTDQTTLVTVYVDSNNDASYSRSTDGGAAWGAATNIEAGTARGMACWFDQETPGITTDEIHVVWVDSADSEFKYCDIDISAGTNGSVITIASGLGTVSAFNERTFVGVTKALSGRIYAAYHITTDDTNYTSNMYYSDNGGATWSGAVNSPWEDSSDGPDLCKMFPANTGDNDDICAIYFDSTASVEELSLKMYDATADSWTETVLGAHDNTNLGLVHHFDGAVRHSDNHVIVASHSIFNNSTDDLQVFDLTVDSTTTPTVTSKTDVFTNQDNSGAAAVFIDQNSDDIYVAYGKGTTAFFTDVDIVYHKSTDGGATWGAEQAYSEATADDARQISCGRTVRSGQSGLFQPSWTSNTDAAVYVNLVNDVAIAAPTGGLIHAGIDHEATLATNAWGVLVR